MEDVEDDDDIAPTSPTKKARCNIVEEDSGDDDAASPSHKSLAMSGSTPKARKVGKIHKGDWTHVDGYFRLESVTPFTIFMRK